MKVQATVLTHRGLKRTSNEDCLAVAGWVRSASLEVPRSFAQDLARPTLFAVADGLGGHASGELASLIALSRLEERLSGFQGGEPLEALGQHVLQIHAELQDLSRSSNSLRGFGTTLAGVLLEPGGGIKVFNVGDSRVYRRQDNYLEQVSTDDRMPSASYGDAQTAASNALLQCLGGEGAVEVHSSELSATAKAETFLLCTDGLHDMVSIDDIEGCMSADSEAWAKQLFDRVCKAGAADNVSIVILSVATGAEKSE